MKYILLSLVYFLIYSCNIYANSPKYKKGDCFLLSRLKIVFEIKEIKNKSYIITVYEEDDKKDMDILFKNFEKAMKLSKKEPMDCKEALEFIKENK